MLAIKCKRRPNQLASELLSYRQSSWQWQTVNAGHKSARYIKQAVMQYQSEYPYDTISVRYTDDGEASIVIQRSAGQMDRLVKPSELLSGDYYSRGVNKILSDFNIQVTANAAQASYEDIEIRCNDLLDNEVTKQLYKSGWLSTIHDPGNGMVTIVVNVHESILKQRWEDMG